MNAQEPQGNEKSGEGHPEGRGSRAGRADLFIRKIAPRTSGAVALWSRARSGFSLLGPGWQEATGLACHMPSLAAVTRAKAMMPASTPPQGTPTGLEPVP